MAIKISVDMVHQYAILRVRKQTRTDIWYTQLNSTTKSSSKVTTTNVLTLLMHGHLLNS